MSWGLGDGKDLEESEQTSWKGSGLERLPKGMGVCCGQIVDWFENEVDELQSCQPLFGALYWMLSTGATHSTIHLRTSSVC